MELHLSYAWRNNGTGIFTHMWLMFMAHVGKYSSPVDPMGYVSSLMSFDNLCGCDPGNF